MKTDWIQQYFEAPDDTGSGNTALDILNDEPDAGGAPDPTPTPTPTPAFDAAALGKTFAAELATHFGKQAPVSAQPEPKQQPLSPEERDRLLNVMQFDDGFLQKFGNIETQKEAFAALRDGLIKHADTLAQVRMNLMQQAMEKQFEERFGPIQSHFERQQAEAAEQRFATSYPQLAVPAFKPIVDAVANQLISSGALQGKTEKEAYSALASGVSAVIKQSNPAFELTTEASASQPQRKKTQANPNAIPATTPGGGGGGGNGNSGAPQKAKALQFL